mmetsp:Transcript_17074/g.25079  ORF Transcript_17074/g.25079 Transcript_17074/m.25079 type:complete len:138 (+) Transcript_17074:290-703(+)
MSGPWTITQEREERAAKEGTDAIQAPRAILDTVAEEPEELTEVGGTQCMPHAAFAAPTPQSRTNTPPVQPTWHDEVAARDATEAVRCEEAGAVCSEGVLKVDHDLIDGHLPLPTALFTASDGSKEGDASAQVPRSTL